MSSLYDRAKAYYETYGNLLVMGKDKETGKMRSEIAHLRDQYEKGIIDPDTKKKYDEIGMVWKDAENKEWNYCYDMAKQYYQLFGTLDMPKTLVLNGVRLNEWLETQKETHKNGELSLGRIEKLEKLNIEWDKEIHDSVSFSEKAVSYYMAQHFEVWNSYKPTWLGGRELDIYLPRLKVGIEYDGGKFHTRRNLGKDIIKNNLCDAAGVKLIRIRDSSAARMERSESCDIIRRDGKGLKGLDKAITAALKKLGVENPDVNCERDSQNIYSGLIEDKTFFKQYLMAAKHFYEDNGHLLVPKNYEDPTGVRLGQWITNVRESKKFLSDKQINSLDDIGMIWEDVKREKWLYNMDMVMTYGKDIPDTAKTCDGKPLKEWFEKQEREFNSGSMKDNYKIDSINKYKEENSKSKLRSRGDDFSR